MKKRFSLIIVLSAFLAIAANSDAATIKYVSIQNTDITKRLLPILTIISCYHGRLWITIPIQLAHTVLLLFDD